MHAISNKVFPVKENKKYIQKVCDEWGEANRDHLESSCYGLGEDILFKNLTFESYSEACDYLSDTPSYSQTAVMYKKYPNVKPSKTLSDLNRRVEEYENKLSKLNEPHYRNVKQSYVKCKCCGSSLSTKHCGSGYKNNCPVCGSELRPASTLDKIQSCKETLADLRKRRNAEQKKHNAKCENKAELFWVVHCEVHC